MKKTLIFLLLLNLFAEAQVGINTSNPHPSAMLDLTSTFSGILIPRMTSAQKTAIIAPATGLLIYQTDATSGFWYFDGIIWKTFASTGWSLTGDIGTNPTTNFLGTTDNQDFFIATNNSESIRFQTDGDIGIGQVNPTTKLHITGTSPSFRLQDGNQGANKVLTSDANGNATWKTNSTLNSSDDDWRFNSGNTFADPIYHTGKVIIGRTGTTTHHIDIDNGLNTGTTFGIGNNEYLQDGNNETQFSHRLTPISDNTISLGSSSKRWRTVYATNGTIQTSDANDKTNITPLNYGIETIQKMNPIRFKWKNESYLNYTIPNEKRELKLGFLAQDLQQIIPEVVYDYSWLPKNEAEKDQYIKVKNEYLGVNYEELLAVLVKAKQEQQLELEKLEQETAELLKIAQQLNTKNHD